MHCAKALYTYIHTSLSIITYRPPEISGPARGFGGLGRAFSLRLARARRLLKKTQGFALDFRVLSLEHGRPGPIRALPDAPGLVLGGRNASIFELFRRSRAFGANFVRSVQNYGRSYIFRTSELLRDDKKTSKNRAAGSFDSA